MKRLNYPFMLIAAFAVAMVVLFARPAPCALVAHGPPTTGQALVPEIDGVNPTGDALVAFALNPVERPNLDEVAIPVIYEFVEGYPIFASMFDDTGQIVNGSQNGSATTANTDAIAACASTVPDVCFDRLDMENSIVAKTAATAIPEVAYYVIWPTEGNNVALRFDQDSCTVDDTVSAAAAWNPSNWTGVDNTSPPHMGSDIGSSTASNFDVNPLDRLGLWNVQRRT